MLLSPWLAWLNGKLYISVVIMGEVDNNMEYVYSMFGYNMCIHIYSAEIVPAQVVWTVMIATQL